MAPPGQAVSIRLVSCCMSPSMHKLTCFSLCFADTAVKTILCGRQKLKSKRPAPPPPRLLLSPVSACRGTACLSSDYKALRPLTQVGSLHDLPGPGWLSVAAGKHQLKHLVFVSTDFQPMDAKPPRLYTSGCIDILTAAGVPDLAGAAAGCTSHVNVTLIMTSLQWSPSLMNWTWQPWTHTSHEQSTKCVLEGLLSDTQADQPDFGNFTVAAGWSGIWQAGKYKVERGLLCLPCPMTVVPVPSDKHWRSDDKGTMACKSDFCFAGCSASSA